MNGPPGQLLPISTLITSGLLLTLPLFAQPATTTGSLLSFYALENKKPLTSQLPHELREISGLAADGEGKILCHNDEQAIVFEIDPVRGSVAGQYSVGDRFLRRDFEGIAVADSLVYLVTSDGKLFEFGPKPPGGRAAAQQYSTGLSSAWNVEGLCYDPVSRSLLLACKENPADRRKRRIYSYSLASHTLESIPRFVIDLQKLERDWHIKTFHPSSIERHPVSGTFFVLSSSEPAILELSASGEILSAKALPQSVHRQPEGLTFGADLTLYVSNEGKDHGIVVRYPYVR